jgi:hypothetical protein
MAKKIASILVVICGLRGQFYLAHNGVIADIVRFIFGGRMRGSFSAGIVALSRL